MPVEAREALLAKVMTAAAPDGLADRSLREIAASADTSHRMLIYHFGSREGLLAAIVAAMEAQQRAALTAMAGGTPREVMTGLWRQVSSPELRPFVRLFFEVFALSSLARSHRDEAGPRDELTAPWLDDATAAAESVGMPVD